jgi:hypothetical protein
MITIKKRVAILLIALFTSLPIFVYFNESKISLSYCINHCAAIQPITFVLLLLIFLLILKNKLILLLFILFFSFTFEFFFYNSIELLLLPIKSIIPFFFLIGFILIKEELKHNLSFAQFLINIFIPYCIIFFQILIFFSETFYFFQGFDLAEPLNNIFFLNIKIYNYNQYFSFILVLVCGIRLFLISKKKEEFFLSSMMLLSSYHANNYTSLICAIIIIFFKIIFLIIPKNNQNVKILKLISYLFALMIIILPLSSFILIQLTSDFINEANFNNLYSRFLKYDLIINNLKFENLIYGAYANSFGTGQPHSQFLEYILHFGFLRAAVLIAIIYLMIFKISRIEYLLPVCIIIGFGGAFTELFSHWYNSQIIFFYICLSSLIKTNKKKLPVQ